MTYSCKGGKSQKSVMHVPGSCFANVPEWAGLTGCARISSWLTPRAVQALHARRGYNSFREEIVDTTARPMASDLGQNRYSDFVALETLLRFENCSSSHCLLSSWRRFHVVESSHPSFHRTVFFGAPLAFLRGVAMGLCRRCVIFMSSCNQVFLSSTGLHTWAGT